MNKTEDLLKGKPLSNSPTTNTRRGALASRQQGIRKHMRNNDWDPVFAGDYAYIPEGTYEALVVSYERAEFYRQDKIYLWFKVINGSNQGTKIFMACNLYKKIRRSCKYYKAYLVANKGVKPKANNRMSPKIFSNKVFSIKVRTVKSGCKQERLSKDDKYSVVDEILEVCTG